MLGRSHFRERVLHAGASELTMGEVEGDQSSRKGCGSRSSRRLDVMKRDSAKSISSILPANLHWLGFSEFKRWGLSEFPRVIGEFFFLFIEEALFYFTLSSLMQFLVTLKTSHSIPKVWIWEQPKTRALSPPTSLTAIHTFLKASSDSFLFLMP